ncbi:MAG: CD225/dispanin family protein [Tannerella sp.]|jgi:uncharacterized integral membrane protein|nr:CD225/dispanin family protein [Tannerella sp.]
MEKEYFYLIGETRVGPLSLDELRRASITYTTYVWNNTLPEWAEARTLPELEGCLSPAAPSQTPPRTPGYSSAGAPPMPDNYLVWAVLATVLCCLPLGIVSIINSTKVSSLYAAGDYAGAQKAAADAKKWAMWSAISAGIVLAIYAVIMVIILAAGLSGM